MGRSGLAVGLNRGYITTAIAKKKIRSRPSLRKGTLGKRVKSIRYKLPQNIFLDKSSARSLDSLLMKRESSN